MIGRSGEAIEQPLGGGVTKFMKVSKYLSGRRLRIGGWRPTYGQTHAAGEALPQVWRLFEDSTWPRGAMAWVEDSEQTLGSPGC